MADDSGIPRIAGVRSLWLGFGLLFVTAAVVACAQETSVVLELKDVQFFNAEQTSTSPATIRLSGLAFHSSLVVQEISTTRHEETLKLLVHLAPASAGLSGSFDYTLTVPPAVNTVSFGREEIVIWNRATGVVEEDRR